jgi:hypothetical protein
MNQADLRSPEPIATTSTLVDSPFFSLIGLNRLGTDRLDTNHLDSQWFQVLLNPQSPWLGAGLGIALVSVPVFFEAPLVRALPWLCLGLAGMWFWLGYQLWQHPRTQFWGDLLLGLSWSWLAGSIYWGWFRWDPALHLPIEAIGLPMALWGLYRGWGKVGHCFYLGSLLGTAVTDTYFYGMGLMPYWRQIMQADPSEAFEIIGQAMVQVQTPLGILAGLTCATVLLVVGLKAWRSTQMHLWVLSGAVLGTLFVDSLFVVLAGF